MLARLRPLAAAASLLALLSSAHAQTATLSAQNVSKKDPPYPTLAGSVIRQQKVSETEGGFTGVLTPATDPAIDPGDLFGISVAPIGDLDHDGIVDLAVGAYCDDEGGFMTGAIWILFMNADQTVRTQQKISKNQGNFAGPIHKADLFGWSLCSLGDLDSDGSPELAVGGWLDDDGFGDAGAVWILSLNPDGTVKHQQKISATQGGFTGQLETGERFGTSLVNLGDLDGDGVTDLAAGAVYDNQGGHLVGAEWILFLNPDATVKSWTKITNDQGGMPDVIETYSRFSYAAASLGDLDGDGIVDLAVGAITDHPLGNIQPLSSYECQDNCGAIWILFLNHDGTVRAWQKIGQDVGGFSGEYITNENLAHAVTSPGDLDGDGVPDLLVGAVGDGGPQAGTPQATGTVWALFLNKNGTVKGQRRIDAQHGGFTGHLDPGDFFGQSLASLGDLNGDGIGDVAVGAIGDDDGGLDQGAFWFLYLYGPNWSSAGDPSAGSKGLPKLAVESSLDSSAPLIVHLEQAAANAPALLVVSPSSNPQPMHGGTLVPSIDPPVLIVPFLTNASGGLTLKATCPHAWPAGLQIYLQCWIKDPAAPWSFASTNTLVGTTP